MSWRDAIDALRYQIGLGPIKDLPEEKDVAEPRPRIPSVTEPQVDGAAQRLLADLESAMYGVSGPTLDKTARMAGIKRQVSLDARGIMKTESDEELRSRLKGHFFSSEQRLRQHITEALSQFLGQRNTPHVREEMEAAIRNVVEQHVPAGIFPEVNVDFDGAVANITLRSPTHLGETAFDHIQDQTPEEPNTFLEELKGI